MKHTTRTIEGKPVNQAVYMRVEQFREVLLSNSQYIEGITNELYELCEDEDAQLTHARFYRAMDTLQWTTQALLHYAERLEVDPFSNEYPVSHNSIEREYTCYQFRCSYVSLSYCLQ